MSIKSDLRYVGNFDNQGGGKILLSVMLGLREKIDRDIIDIERGWTLSDGDDDYFVVALHIYGVMVEHYKLFAVKPQTVRHWRDVYMPAFNQFCEDTSVGAWGDERHAVILDVFAHLEKVVMLLHPDDKEG
ncbi:MAG: hypothetical protein ABI947_28005 [Chloroflexota bacterium]